MMIRKVHLPCLFSVLWVVGIVLAIGSGGGAHARIDLKAGDVLPEADLVTAEGKQYSTLDQGYPRVYVLGQSGHKGTDEACASVLRVLQEPELVDTQIQWFVVLSKHSDFQRAAEYGDADRRPKIVHDADRSIFGAFDVITVPTVIVVDRQARVVHVTPGMMPRFEDIVSDAIRLASGQIEPEAFQRTLHPPDSSVQEDRVRAIRFVQLARKFDSAGMVEQAKVQYREAIRSDASYLQPRLELGYLYERQGEFESAREVFQGLIQQSPGHVQARLGYALTIIKIDEQYHEEAMQIARSVISELPGEGQAYFVVAEVSLSRGETEKALANYRKSARLLIESSRFVGEEGS